ncbi:uncharacterized protein YecT (DUF1311 family) [Paraburkholderia bannensis]|uniref:Uncharacterized protein YecT (DUF1311 family) n=1 Tax=Paraburkholderia bannensis TaxID=765414 RepID=A0A7W9U704_9BURK|nr:MULTISPECIES: lysozyme inhibitor LprI family protein [Paraburkholderia]MBB3262121.1 uncharacterized protein YecT (DUF1311 family) [Paraburkholderia sp. WP4_3_2]MBB6107120.1 uncharacterized protein YecT (DUF1311 family) [Paraburkholderia bannensis]
MRKIIFLSILFLVSQSSFSKPCDAQTNNDLERCAQAGYESSDKQLNSSYADLLKKLPEVDRKNLIVTQRAWIGFKEKYCQSQFDSIRPGEEAGIDKWTCLDTITESRAKEIGYLAGVSGMEEFRRSLKLMANLYEHGDTEKVISKLLTYNAQRNDQNWINYVNLDCRMTNSRLSEEHNACVARLNFYRDW